MHHSSFARILLSFALATAGAAGCAGRLLGGGTSTGTGLSYRGGSSDVAGGTGGGADRGAAASGDDGPRYPEPDKPGAIDASAPEPVQALWRAFREVHAGATDANAEETGRKLWPLLSGDVHAAVATRFGDLVRGFGSGKMGVDLEHLTYRVLGQIAAVHANQVVGGDIEVTMRSRDDGTVTAEYDGHYAGDHIPSYEAREEDGQWRMVDASGLFSGPDLPRHDDLQHPTDREALAVQWIAVLEHGHGRDAYDMLSGGTHSQMLSAANQGGLNLYSVVAALDAALAARQARKVAITGHAVDGAELTLTYADGSTETFKIDKFGDEYFIDMM